MDPVTIVSILGVILSCAQTIFDTIDKNNQLGAAEHGALKALRRTVGDVENDIKFFKTMISALDLESTENEQFLQGHDVINAMKNFYEDLSALNILLGTEPATESFTLPDVNNSLRSILVTLMRVPLAKQRTVVSDLTDARNNILNNQQNINRNFKLIWYLYTISQQRASTKAIFTMKRGGLIPLDEALDAVSWEFIGQPFGISQPLNSFPLSVLNRDHNAASRQEELATKLGRGWINDRVNRHHVPANQLIDVQATLFELIWSGTVPQLKKNLTHTTNDPEHREFEVTLHQLDKSLQEVIVRLRRPKFTVSFYGMVKAGKSLFLNSLIGSIVLPSNELPSTAWPCRLVHVKGMKQPELCVRTEQFNNAIKCLREKCYGAEMKKYRPPATSVLGAMTGGDLDAEGETSPEANKLEKIYNEWKKLHKVTRSNLHTFEEPDFQLPRQVSEVKAVIDLLGKINDIVRLCKLFDVKFEGTEEDWPVLRVEFSSLKERNVNEIYEFIDLPGVGEHLNNSSWESLVQLAASQSDAIVPIVSFTEISRSDWRELPRLAGYNRKADLVVCTHLDRVSGENLQQQTSTVSESFWPNEHDENGRILKCSSLMGLSASQLLEQTKAAKPTFKEVWDQTSIRYQCASKILGEGEPQSVYERYDRGRWEGKVECQLEKSGLPHVIHKLTQELVDRARKTALTSQMVEAIRLVRELRKKEGRRLLEVRRTEVEFEEAKKAYDDTSQKLQAILSTWDLTRKTQIDKSRKQLQNACAFITRKADGFVQSALAKVLQRWGLVDRDSDSDSTNSMSRTPRGARFTNQVLTVTSVAHAKEFFRLSQEDLHIQLRALNAEYVDAVRRLGQEARSFRITTLRDALKNATAIETEIRDDVIAELESHSFDIRELAYQEIKKVIKKSYTTYTAKTAFKTIEARIARLWLNTPSKENQVTSESDLKHHGGPGDTQNYTDEDANVEAAAQRAIDSLGFMLRASTTVMTTITWTLAAPFWVFMPHSHTYHLDLDVIRQQYKTQIVQPWIESLNKEGDRTLLGTIRLSSDTARESVNSALEREKARYQREIENKQQPLDEETVGQLVATYVNLLAAEEALQELNGRIDPQ